MADVCLVSMPYAATEHPSIALGILEACLQKAGIDVTTIYGNILFAEAVGLKKYAIIEYTRCDGLLGEWTFAGCAFPAFQPDHKAFFRLLPHESTTLESLFWELRTQAGPFIDRLAHTILDMHPRIVGCTSTFQQNCASLALLRRIKELAPDTITLMGGANCEGCMGLTIQQEFPWVDFVVSGEADDLIGDLCHTLLEAPGIPDTAGLPYGVIGKKDRRKRSLLTPAVNVPRAIARDLNNIPTPNYDSYFTALSESPLRDTLSPGLLIETSRGCWWGQKHHCTFCGLNGLGMGYRSKSPDRVREEFGDLAARYKLRKFETVDNILDMDYMDTVLAELGNLREKYSLFWETKANLKRSHIQRLAEAGVIWIQPGIEGLHDDFLKAIDKGTTALINVQLLKWGREYGIRLSWNLLANIPGERDEWYMELASWLPLIVHLQPPSGVTPIRYERYSPYFNQAEKYGIRLKASKPYSYIYPLSETALFDLAYFFEDINSQDASGENTLESNKKQVRPGLEAVRAQIKEWQTLFAKRLPPILSLTDHGHALRILDTRPCATKRWHILEGLAADIYRACDAAIAAKGLLRVLNDGPQPGVLWEDVASILEQLQQDKLLLNLNEKFLSLAVQGSIPTLPDLMDFPGGSLDLATLAYVMQTTQLEHES